VRRAGGLTYHPSFDRAQFLSLAMGYRLLETTWLRAALLASSGSPTTPLAQVIVWDSPDPLGSQGEFAGTPERTTGPLNAARLPAYVRLDLGVRHDWALRLGSRPVLVTGFLDFHNVLDRANLLGYFVSPAAATHPLSLLPRGLTFGLEWRY
jgi:hypothetical protein